MRLSGSCHCSGVTVIAPAPEYLNSCNCTLCSKIAGLWAYYTPDAVDVSGNVTGYVRKDLKYPGLTNWHCPVCGMTTHWTLLGHGPHARTGVNARVFGARALEGVEVRLIDGLSWEEPH
jgi:hypothetical protein